MYCVYIYISYPSYRGVRGFGGRGLSAANHNVRPPVCCDPCRLIYWAAAAFGSSVRAFGFGLSFLPSVVMMVANFYFIFTVEAAGSIFSTSPGAEPLAPPPGKQRFWG